MSSNDPNVNYKFKTENFLETIFKHASLKKKIIRGKFIRRNFLWLKNKYSWDPFKLTYKKQRNLCVSIRRKSITNCINKLSDKGFTA